MLTKRILLCSMLAVMFVTPALAADPHKLALQISDNDPEKMTAVMNVAANVSKYFSDKGEEVEIQIVAFNAGLHIVRADTSPVKDRVVAFSKSMPNVRFKACQNTINSLAKREGNTPPIIADVDHVPAGVVTLMELAEQGWTIVRP